MMRIIATLACISILAFVAGCSLNLPSLPVLGSESGKLTLTNQLTEEVALSTDFDRSIYMLDDKENLTVLLIKGTAQNPQQILTIRMFWKPIPAETPIDPTATNATLHLAIFGEDATGKTTCGVYSGAGFVYLYNDPGSRKLKAGIWQANVILSDSTKGYKNTLTETLLEGKLIAIENEANFNNSLYSANDAVNKALGYPRFILGPLKSKSTLAVAR